MQNIKRGNSNSLPLHVSTSTYSPTQVHLYSDIYSVVQLVVLLSLRCWV